MLKIIVESRIPYIKGRLEPWAQVEYLDTEAITPQAVRSADALLVRTRTRCNAHLLGGSRVSFIGTATIGTDHIDLDYCASRGIAVANAPGCNAPAVAQWVLASIGRWMDMRGVTNAHSLTLGVVGVGHVGSIVERWARQLGLNVLLCDPPRARREGPDGFCTMRQLVARSTIITFHTPLSAGGDYPTVHLCDEAMLSAAAKCRLLINAARGPIADNAALLRWTGDVAIDCWEHEPAISPGLLQKAFVATPHIAGYSSEGKQRGTAMVIEALNRHFGISAQPPKVTAPAIGAAAVTFGSIMRSYDPLADTARLKATPSGFEQQRNHYPLRPEVP